jgi:hypothetical protein
MRLIFPPYKSARKLKDLTRIACILLASKKSSGATEMLKATTHYEQVSLGLVMKILEQDDRRKESEESRLENEQNRNAALPANTAKREGV